MQNSNKIALLLCDTYKQCHQKMYPKGTTQLVSYWTPRKSMLQAQNEMVFFGLQAFIKKYLIEYFQEHFFKLDKVRVESAFRYFMNIQLGVGNYDVDKVMQLHKLGYLPILIRALPEGSLVPMGVPCIEVTNTHPDFAWVVQWIECILQAELWKPCCHATIGHMYREIVNYWYEETVVGAEPSMACSDFGMRGMSCVEEAMKCSAAWLLSFDKTSTIPALDYIKTYYHADFRKPNGKPYGIGAVSTEHSVMSANYAVDGDEITFIRRLLNEIYPDTSFSMVSDTYDYWNLVENILPQVKDDVLKHNGKLLIRPDSGDIVEISVETIKDLWEIFGGSVNEKGYKVLDPHIGIIYGDSCTLAHVETIYKELERLGYAANNIVFGVGAFCFSAIQDPYYDEKNKLVVITRDTFGIAMKATYAIINGESKELFKDPKTDNSHLKKSHRGCCKVLGDWQSGYCCVDRLDHIATNDQTALQKVFENGIMPREDTFGRIRERLNYVRN